jgi:hypothetical protein
VTAKEKTMERPAAASLDDEGDEPSALEEAFVRYQENGLRLPPVPRELVDELDEFAEWRWGSEDLDLEDRDGFLAAARTPGGENEVAFGHVGHGVSSWWLCYRLKLDALAVFVRLGYGGAYDDTEETVPAINATTAALEDLIPAASAAKAAGRLRGGHRLIVVIDEKRNGFWEIAGGADGRHRSDDPLGEAMAFLSEPMPPDPAP